MMDYLEDRNTSFQPAQRSVSTHMRLGALAVLLALTAALDFKYHNYNELTTYLHDTVRLYPTRAQVGKFTHLLLCAAHAGSLPRSLLRPASLCRAASSGMCASAETLHPSRTSMCVFPL